MLRTPRTLWSRHPAASSDVLLRAHLERREEIAGAIGHQPESPLSLDSYINGEAIQYAAQRLQMRRKSIFVGWYEMLFFGVLPHDEWLGGLEC